MGWAGPASLRAVSSPRSGQGLTAALRGGARRARSAARGLLAEPPAETSPAAVTAPWFDRELRPGRLAVEAETVTNVLYDRLSEQDVRDAEEAIRAEPGAWAHYFGTAERASSRDLLLALAVWLDCRAVIERTGLIRAEPPEDVHSMTRGAQNAAGGLYEANMVIDALRSAGGEIERVGAALDFGCSSGRVLRPLAAAYPHVAWHGCDPNERAVRWAAEQLPGVSFFGSGDRPPLALEDDSLDLAYAISIWSHFEPQRGLEWFEEMRRLLRPGGHLVITTHGPTSVAYYCAAGLRTASQSLQIATDLYRRGWWYAAEFGEAGDWGVVDPHWGTAFLSPEWLLTQLCPGVACP